jgi:enamine deaminase RidA (YjgF/YER057c/UK114 family)
LIPVFPEARPSGDSPLSPGARVGNWLFISGQVPRDEDGNWVETGLADQTRCVLDNLLDVVAAAGGTAADVCKINAYLRDEREFASFNEVYRTYFPSGASPARTTLCAVLMRPQIQVEVEGIAHIGLASGRN